jgi:uncharacterized protein
MAIEIILIMIAAGLIVGFVGAGGSGFIISILTVLFGFPIHVALGTALASMLFSSFSGAVSHYREGNVTLRAGLIIGIFGAVGAFISSHFSGFIPEDILNYLTAGMLVLSGVVLCIRLLLMGKPSVKGTTISAFIYQNKVIYFISAALLGILTGALSGLFGIGSAPFIQIGLLILLGLSAQQSAGTTMMIIIPIALAGGVGYAQLGFLDIKLLLEVVAGTMIGSYIGAKFTKRVRPVYLKTAMVLLPIFAGFLLLSA